MARIRVLVVDDHPLFRRGLIDLLRDAEDMDVVGEAASAEEALAVAREQRPDVVLMDIFLPGDGVVATRAIREALPETKVLVLTVSEEDEHLFAAIQAGANGYVLKEVTPEELLAAIRRVHEGQAVLAPPVAAKLLDRMRRGAIPGRLVHRQSLLTEREVEVVRLLAQGLTNQEIARRLIIAESTVKTHIRNILRKTGTRNRAEVVAWATQRGLIDIADRES